MPNRSPLAPGSAEVEQANVPCPPLPADLAYQVETILPTDSKMSEILLATDSAGQRVILKVACVQQAVRAVSNRRAIHNSVLWLQHLHGHRGIAQMQPIQRRDKRGLLDWFTPPTYVATLPNWPGNPDFLVTEYLTGGDLSRFVGKRPLPLDLALYLAYDLARTLAWLHAHGCVHRDLKPENILFRVPPSRTADLSTLQPVLIDFGIAAAAGKPKMIAGSRLWMAPELQVADEKTPLPVDPAWDVFALGLICCYMLSGLLPQRQRSAPQNYVDYRALVFAFLQQEAHEGDAAWSTLTATLQQWLSRTLEAAPHNRPTAAEFAAGLADLLTQLGISIPPENRGERRWQPLVQRWQQMPQPWRLGGVMTLVLVSLLFLSRILAGDQEMGEQIAPSAPPVVALVAELPTATASPTPQVGPETLVQPTTATQLPPTLAKPTLPPPTLAALPTLPDQAIPTLAQNALVVLSSSTLTPTALPPTSTALVIFPTPTQRPKATVARTVIKLRTPPPDTRSAQERVEFAWEIRGVALAREHCYELVFWDPALAGDKRSPTGAGRSLQGTVNFSKLRASPDSLLRRLAHSPQGFAWGVRVVACAAPKTIIQDVGEIRHFVYAP